jgi:hypothetical protein
MKRITNAELAVLDKLIREISILNTDPLVLSKVPEEVTEAMTHAEQVVKGVRDSGIWTEVE